MPSTEIHIELDTSKMAAHFSEAGRLWRSLPAERWEFFRRLREEKLPNPCACAVVCEEEVPAVGATKVVVRVEPSKAFLEFLVALRAANGEVRND